MINRLLMIRTCQKLNQTNQTLYSVLFNSKKFYSNAEKKPDLSDSEQVQVAGSDYFRKIVNKSSPSNMNLKLEDLNLDKNNIGLDDVNRGKNRKVNSQEFAKRFLSKQIEYQKKQQHKKNDSNQSNKAVDFEKEIFKSNSKPKESLEPEENLTSKPRNFQEEIKQVKKFSNKQKIQEKKLRSQSYHEFRYPNEFKKEKSSIKKLDPTQQLRDFDENPKIEPENNSLSNSSVSIIKPEELSVLDNEDEDKLTEDEKMEREIKNLRPSNRPVVYNLAYFVNKSEVLKKFVEMGVFIRKWDEDTSIGSFILKLDMERDVKPHLIFLHDIGIPPENHAFIITKNPMFFKDSIEDLKTRIEYLKSKKFTQEMIKQIVVQAPKWLSLSVSEVDTKLGWFQREFGLNGSELREIVSEKPKLVTLPLQIASNMKFGLKDFLTYDDKELKSLIKSFPKLFTKDFKKIEANFIFLTQVVKLKHEEIASHPPVLVAPLLLLKSRYAYLKHLNRIQFDPTKPNYISLRMLIEPDDKIFCQKSAKTNLDDYKQFLKTV